MDKPYFVSKGETMHNTMLAYSKARMKIDLPYKRAVIDSLRRRAELKAARKLVEEEKGAGAS